ncbi:unnamed protein product, partial [Pleuronectes platessa]
MASLRSDEWKAICDRFTNAQNLTEVESRKDPENEPFRSKYKARELLREIYSALKCFEAGDGEDQEQEEECGGGCEQRPAEQPVDGQRDDGEHLTNCLKLLGRCTASSDNVSLFINARNQLGILSAGWDETEAAQGFLETAESIYLRYMKEDGSPPTDMTEYFTTEENLLTHQERTKRFELAYTHTMYYLAQVYKNLGQNERSATYCHSTLQRQLKLKEFNPMEWALNAASLSQYYIIKGNYMEGRHCLSAATVVAGLAGEAPSEAAAQESETESEAREQLRQKRADIARCWIKYCLNLLQDAKKQLE